jgi:chromosome segregation ATPase
MTPLRAQNATLEQHNTTLQDEVEQLKKKLAAMDQHMARERERAGASEAETLETNSTIAALETRVSTVDAQIMVTTNNLNVTKKQLAAAQEDLAAEQAESKRLGGKVGELAKELEGEKGKVEKLQSKIDSGKKAREVEVGQLKTLATQVKKYSAKSEELLVALAGEKSGKSAMAKQLAAAISDKNDALSRVSSFDDREAELVRKLHFMDDVRLKLHNRVMQLTGNIRVFVRVRPSLNHEQEAMQVGSGGGKRGGAS